MLLDGANTRHKIRLGGIDAPEKKQIYGDKSTQNLANLIAGKNVEVEYSKRGRYGRIICYKTGQFICSLQLSTWG